MIAQNDLEQVAHDRVAQQYRESEKLLAMIDLFVGEIEEAQAAAFEVLASMNIDEADGWALDVIGRILGLPRPLIDAEAFEYFGFSGASGAREFGAFGIPYIGGRFASVFSPLNGQVPLEDEDYRVLLRAKAIRNTTDASPESVLEVIRAAFPDISPVSLSEGPTAEVRIVFGRLLSTIEKGLVIGADLVPVPICVSAAFIESEGALAFGFAGSVGLGFGSGAFASLIG